MDQLQPYILVIVTAAVAYHGITFRDDEGAREIGHLLFGCIALLFSIRFLFEDILQIF